MGISFDVITGALTLAAFPLLMLVIVMVIAPNGVDLDEVVQGAGSIAPPQGVQEEEPLRWNVERLHRSRPEPSVLPAGAAKPATR